MRQAVVALAGLALIGGTVLLWRRGDERGRPVWPPEAVLPTTTVPAREPWPTGFSPRGRWVVGEAIDGYVAEHRLAGTVTLRDRRQLIAALGRLRRSARRTERARVVTPRIERRHLEIVTETDRIFREKLGVGVSDFIAEMSAPNEVQDLGRRGR
jgi:hypothetical protein